MKAADSSLPPTQPQTRFFCQFLSIQFLEIFINRLQSFFVLLSRSDGWVTSTIGFIVQSDESQKNGVFVGQSMKRRSS